MVSLSKTTFCPIIESPVFFCFPRSSPLTTITFVVSLLLTPPVVYPVLLSFLIPHSRITHIVSYAENLLCPVGSSVSAVILLLCLRWEHSSHLLDSTFSGISHVSSFPQEVTTVLSAGLFSYQLSSNAVNAVIQPFIPSKEKVIAGIIDFSAHGV